MADYIRTVTGIMIAPLEAKEEDICIEDIAHALSFLCRAGGHYRKFYSVGAHSINCYDEAVSRNEKKRIQLACLLHDATEAYMADVTRPVKKNFPQYSEYEDELADKIFRKYLGKPLESYEKAIVKSIDDAMLFYEFYEFTAYRLSDEAPYVAATPNFFQGEPDMVERNFLSIFESLIEEVKEEEKKEENVPKLKLDTSRLFM